MLRVGSAGSTKWPPQPLTWTCRRSQLTSSMLPHTAMLPTSIDVAQEAPHRQVVVAVVPGAVGIARRRSGRRGPCCSRGPARRGTLAGQTARRPRVKSARYWAGSQSLMVALVQVGLDVRAQVEQVALLGPGREVVAAALRDIRRGAGLRNRPASSPAGSPGRAIEDVDVGMGRRETVSSICLGHGRKPLGAPVLVDELQRAGVVRSGQRRLLCAATEGQAGSGGTGQPQKCAALDAPPGTARSRQGREQVHPCRREVPARQPGAQGRYPLQPSVAGRCCPHRTRSSPRLPPIQLHHLHRQTRLQ